MHLSRGGRSKAAVIGAPRRCNWIVFVAVGWTGRSRSRKNRALPLSLAGFLNYNLVAMLKKKLTPTPISDGGRAGFSSLAANVAAVNVPV